MRTGGAIFTIVAVLSALACGGKSTGGDGQATESDGHGPAARDDPPSEATGTNHGAGVGGFGGDSVEGGSSSGAGGGVIDASVSGGGMGASSAGGFGGAGGVDAGGLDEGGETFGATLSACELATALIRFKLEKRMSLACMRVTFTYGVTTDPRYDVTLPEDWGIEAITYLLPDCEVPTSLQVFSASGRVDWENPSMLVPAEIDIQLEWTLGIGGPPRGPDPGRDSLVASDLPVDRCQ